MPRWVHTASSRFSTSAMLGRASGAGSTQSDTSSARSFQAMYTHEGQHSVPASPSTPTGIKPGTRFSAAATTCAGLSPRLMHRGHLT
jgi:hypothetical protein